MGRKMSDDFLEGFKRLEGCATDGPYMIHPGQAKALVEEMGRINVRFADALELLTAPMWLVWSNEHRAWWGENRRGYCLGIESAGRYTLDEAMEICRARGVERRDGINQPEMIQPSPELLAKRAKLVAAASGPAPVFPEKSGALGRKVCPYCAGAGSLSVAENDSWKKFPCAGCDGRGWIPVEEVVRK